MNRDVLVKILGSLSDDKLIQAMSVIGIKPADIGFDPMQGMAADDSGSAIVPWNERQVPYSGGTDRPTLSDKQWAMDELGNTPVEPTKGDGVLGMPNNPYLQTGGT